jgi:signal transduction histidine kinase
MPKLAEIFKNITRTRIDRRERQHYFTRLLSHMLVILIILSSLYLILRFLQDYTVDLPVMVISGIIAALLVAYYLLRSGNFRISSIIAVIVSFGGMTFIAFTSLGVRDGGILSYLVIIIFTALLLGKLASLIVTVASIIAIWIMVYLENSGFIIYDPWAVEMFARDITLFLILTLVMVIYYESVMNRYIGELNDSKADSQEKNEILMQKNREITQINKELQSAMVKADESDRLKTAFLANLSHEIRTPLNGILGFSELMLSEDTSADAKAEYRDIIKSSGNQLLSIVNDIIDISKIESGELEVNYTTFNLRNALNELYETHKSDAAVKNLSFELIRDYSDESDLDILSDEIKLRQILSNLISNAIKFTYQGFVNFGYKREGDLLIFSVRDSGIGIDKKLQKMVFDRFIQIDSGNDRIEGGTGLGLSIAKAYVEKLGGEIWLESEKARGSHFHFSLPYIEDSTVKTKERKKEAAVKVQKRKVLIVEDVESNEILLKGMLKKYPFDIVVARTGNEALDLFKKEQKLDFILMDLKLPDIDGFTVTARIREIDKEIPIIAQTAYAFAEDRKKALQAGCNDLLSKPITRRTLSKLIDTLFS